jgi:hypothetical protein
MIDLFNKIVSVKRANNLEGSVKLAALSKRDKMQRR